MIKTKPTLNSLSSKIWACLPCRISLILLTGFLGLVIATLIFIDPVLNFLVKPKLLDSINKNGKITLEIDNLNYSFFTNNLSVVKSKFTYFNSTTSGTDSVTILTPSFSFSGINWLKLISGSYSLDGIVINEPLIVINSIQNGEIKNETSENKSSWGKQLYDLLPEELNISELIVNSGTLIHQNKTGEESINDTIDNISIIISGLDHRKDDKKLTFAEEFELKVKGFHRRWEKSGYDFKINNLEASSKNSSLKVDTISFKPFISDQEFFGRRQYRGDRWKINIPEFNLEEVDFQKIFSQNIIAVKRISAGRFNIENYINKRLPNNPYSDPKMPHELMSSLTFGLEIGKLEINKGLFTLESLAPDVERRAQLKFTNITALISNIGNTLKFREEKKPCIIDASAKLQNTGKVNIKMNLLLQQDYLLLDYKGSLESMSAKDLNTHLEVEDHVRIKSGEIVNVIFTVNVNKDRARVNLIPLYNNLKIMVMNKESLKGRKIVSFIANALRVRESNPDEDGKIKSANVTYIKGPKDTFLDVVWQALLKGLGEVVGF